MKNTYIVTTTFPKSHESFVIRITLQTTFKNNSKKSLNKIKYYKKITPCLEMQLIIQLQSYHIYHSEINYEL